MIDFENDFRDTIFDVTSQFFRKAYIMCLMVIRYFYTFCINRESIQEFHELFVNQNLEWLFELITLVSEMKFLNQNLNWQTLKLNKNLT